MSRSYSEADLARLYVVLETNAGNVKKTARDTQLPESTVRDYKKRWETEGPPVISKEIEEAVAEYAASMETTRDLALRRIHERLESPDQKTQGTLPQLATVFGVLTDKIDRARGIADKTVEHKHTLPSPDEIRATLAQVVSGALEAHTEREEEIIDAEFEEAQPPALPRA